MVRGRFWEAVRDNRDAFERERERLELTPRQIAAALLWIRTARQCRPTSSAFEEERPSWMDRLSSKAYQHLVFTATHTEEPTCRTSS